MLRFRWVRWIYCYSRDSCLIPWSVLDDTSDDDTPLAQLVLRPRPRGTTQRTVSGGGPQSGKEKNNARANESKSGDVDAFSGREGTSFGRSYSQMRVSRPLLVFINSTIRCR